MHCPNKLTYPLLQSLKGGNELINIKIKSEWESMEKWIGPLITPSYELTQQNFTDARGEVGKHGIISHVECQKCKECW